MIKTMLLTAQLALSPIVGTNGLQPKLANTDPYTETDLVVSYNGFEYERVLYGKTAYIANNQETFQIGNDFTYKAENEIDNLGFEKVDTLETLFFTTSQGADNKKFVSALTDKCFSMFYARENQNSPRLYVEVLGQNIIIYDLQSQTKTYRTGEATIYHAGNLWTFNTYFESEWLDQERIIPYEQPTKRSNTLYNTIYDFYHGTIFNGAGIAEYETQVGNNTLTMQDWLSHTATIATITLLCVALAVLVIKIFKLIAGSISDIWG